MYHLEEFLLASQLHQILLTLLPPPESACQEVHAGLVSLMVAKRLDPAQSMFPCSWLS
jgi:hypothetical protein